MTIEQIRYEQGKENVKIDIQAHFKRLKEIGDDGDPPLEEMLKLLRK